MQSVARNALSQLSWLTTFPKENYPSVFRRIQPGKSDLPPRSLLIVGLFLFCLIPRLAMAWKLETVCDDGYYYFGIAECLSDGDFETAFAFLNLNIYPAILMAIHSLGFDWVIGGKLWGALVSSCVVLPLFGWVRRLFDDRVAIGACLLYAIHAELIELSVEPIRDATFWLLFTLCFYLTLRAAIETRVSLYLAAGVVMALALHTRIEAVFLTLAVGGFTALRWWSLSSKPAELNQERQSEKSASRTSDFDDSSGGFLGARGRLTVGFISWFAVTPCLLLIVNLTLLSQHSRWEWGRTDHIHAAFSWVASWSPPSDKSSTIQPTALEQEKPHQGIPGPAASDSASPQANSSTSPIDDRHSSTAFWHHAGEYLQKLESQVDPAILVLLLLGFVAWRREFICPDKLLLLLIGFSLLLAVWIRLRHTGEMNARYFAVVLLISLPWASLAFLSVLSKLSRFASSFIRFRMSQPILAGSLLVIVILVGWVDALTSRHKSRAADHQLGLWLRDHLDRSVHINSDVKSARVGYSASGTMPQIAFQGPFSQSALAKGIPDVVLFHAELIPARKKIFLQDAERYGLVPLEAAELPEVGEDQFILVRDLDHADGSIAAKRSTKATR